MNTVLAFDIGGTKISMGLINRQGQLTNRIETSTMAHKGAEAILDQIYDLGHRLIRDNPQAQIRAIGVASAGQIDINSGQVIYATPNLPGWTGIQLGDRLRQSFQLPAICDNDVNAAAQAEISLGACRGIQECLCVVVGTGIGGAVISESKVLHGRGGMGEIGHLTIDGFSGRPCNCGGTGCLETYASSQALLSDLLTLVSPDELFEKTGKTPDECTILDLAASFQQDHSHHWEVLQRVVQAAGIHLGWGLASAANLLNPQTIIIGGSIQAFGPDYLGYVQQAYIQRCLPANRHTEIVFAGLGRDAGLIGIAMLAFDKFGI